ncbi:translation initiation factor IF-3 [bacterium]|nr:translation initiation factor IF-3 [bacterium]
MNEQVTASEVRLIGPDGEQVGVVPISRARAMSEETGFDLVEVAPNAKPPVVRVMDYGKFRYELQKKEKQSRKKGQKSQIKRIRVTPKIEEHDFETKLKSVRQFLEQGDKVKITVIFKGRMVTHKEFGREVIDRFIEATSDIAKPEGNVMMEGARNMVVTLQKK